MTSLLLMLALAEKTIGFSFRNAPIEKVAFALSKEFGTPVIVHPDIKSKITVFSSEKVGRDRAFEIFNSALKISGFEAVIKDGVWIVDKVQPASYIPSYDQPYLKWHKLSHVDPSSISKVLNSLYLPSEQRASYESYSGMLIVNASSRIHPMVESLLKEIDIPVEEKLQTTIIRASFAVSADLSSILKRIFMSQISVSNDARTNSIIMSGRPSTIQHAIKVIEKLDVDVPDYTLVVRLRTADSKNFPALIRGILGP